MRSRFSGESATTKTPVRWSTANATGLMIRPGSLPMCTISHALAWASSTPNTIWLRRSKMKYWPDAARSKPATSLNRPARCAGIASTDSSTSARIAYSTIGLASRPAHSAAALSRSVTRGFPNGLEDIGRLGQDNVLQIGAVRDGRIERSHPADGCVEVVEEVAADPRRDLRAEPARDLILVRHHDAVRARDQRGDGVPVVRRDRPQVEHGGADAVTFGLVRGHERPLHERAPRNHDDIRTVAPQAGLAERDHEVFAGILGLVVRLPVQVLVLEKHHRVVAADGGPEQAGRVRRRRRKCDADPGAVREDALARLAVVRAALDVT